MNLVSRIWTHPANRNHKWAGLTRLIRWQFHKRIIGNAFTFEYHGFKMRGHMDSHSVSAAFYFAGLPDWWEMRFAQDYLRPGDKFLDVGANVGLYTLLASALIGDDGHVDAFEPAEVPASRLQESLDQNSISHIAQVHRFAVTNHSGQVQFGFSHNDCQAHVRQSNESNEQSAKVPAILLDDFCGDTQYAMGKLDIEGHEPMALEGASKMLSCGNPPVLQIEMAGYSQLYGVTTAALIARLFDIGYDCLYYIPDERILAPAPRPWELGLDNVLAVHSPQRELVERRLNSQISSR